MGKDERRQQLSEFLRQRRARLSPFEVGLSPGMRRRTPGLRREEVAYLAGMSVDWYKWLEQGRAISISEQMLSSLAQALQLDSAETAYLFALVFDNSTTPQTPPISSALRSMLDLQGIMPAYILNYCWDIVAWNQSAKTIIADFAAIPADARNMLWLTLTEPALRQTVVNWTIHARRVVSQFRLSYSHHTRDARMRNLIGRLQQVSQEFREWWSDSEVREKVSVCNEFNHAILGHLTFDQVQLFINEDPPLRMVVMVPAAGTNTLSLLQTHLQNQIGKQGQILE